LWGDTQDRGLAARGAAAALEWKETAPEFLENPYPNVPARCANSIPFT